MELKPAGQMSLPEVVSVLRDAVWPGESDEPVAGPEFETRAAESTAPTRAASHLQAIRKIVGDALCSGELKANLRDEKSGWLEIPRGYWATDHARMTLQTGLWETQNTIEQEWQRHHGRLVLIGASNFDSFRTKLLGNRRSVWLDLRTAFMLIDLLTGMGIDEARPSILYKLRDGELAARGRIDTPEGPQVIELDASWWFNLEYRTGANMVVKRDNRAYLTNEYGKEIGIRKPEEMPPGQRAYNVEVRRAELLTAFGLAPEITSSAIDEVGGGSQQSPRATNNLKHATGQILVDSAKPPSARAIKQFLDRFAKKHAAELPVPQTAIIEGAREAFGRQVSRDTMRKAIRAHPQLGNSKPGPRGPRKN